MTNVPTLSPNPDGMEYGGSYIGWKGLSLDGFGFMSRRDQATFDREMRALIGKATGRNLRVLELGFGLGSFLTYGLNRGWEMVGTEIDPELVDAARGAGFEAWHSTELASLPSGGFDVIVGFDVIEHVPQSEIIDLFGHLRRLLRPDGVIFLRFPNGDSWLGNQNFHGDPTHVTRIGHFKLDYFCQRSALTIAAFRPEARLGFDGGIAKGVHALIAGPIVALIAKIIKGLYFPRSRMVLTSANVVAHLRLAVEKD